MPFCELSCKISEKGDVSSEFILVGEICQKKHLLLSIWAPRAELRFVATVTTGGRVKFVPAV